MSLIFIDKVSNPVEFEAKVRAISKQLEISPNDLMLIMNLESGVNAQSQNKKYLVEGQPATGLIQFVKSTAEGLGTSISALYNMTNIEQLDYVYKYFAPYTGRINNVYDLYLITFFPAALGYSDDECIGTGRIGCDSVSKSNPAFDLNKDGQITVGEFKKYIDGKIPSDTPVGYKTAIGRTIMKKFEPVTDNAFVVIAIVVLFIIVILLIIKKIIG